MKATHALAVKALEERFPSMLDMTFLRPEEETAIISLLEDVLDTLMLRGSSRIIMKMAADMKKVKVI